MLGGFGGGINIGSAARTGRESTVETQPAGIDPQVLADLDAVMKRIGDGAAVDPETSRRIEERAERITAEIRRSRGVMDHDRFQALLHDDDDGRIPAANP